MPVADWGDEPRVPYETLYRFVTRMFQALGLRENDARIAAASLLVADVRGIETHGVQRMMFYVLGFRDGRIDPRAELTVDRERLSTIAFSGNHGLGLVMATKAMTRVIAKARESGICLGTIRDSSHYGIAARYALMASDHDMCGMCMTNTSPIVVPFGAKRHALGTNPIAFTAPTNGDPFCLDMATSTVALGKIEVARRLGVPVPDGWSLDADGQPVTDPLLHAGLTPLGGDFDRGGHKGYGLGMMVEIFTSQLASNTWSGQIDREHADGDSGTNGQMFMAIDIAAFRDVQDFKDALSEMCISLKAMEPVDPSSPVLIPGDPEMIATRYNMEHGIPIRKPVYHELRVLGDELGVVWLSD
ncbi:MAG: Ldh family oxidoreductase [Thermomicrobiales bacterium]|nr:Ldh family oxidoreductase [Thermomicrobiales bacterium]